MGFILPSESKSRWLPWPAGICVLAPVFLSLPCFLCFSTLALLFLKLVPATWPLNPPSPLPETAWPVPSHFWSFPSNVTSLRRPCLTPSPKLSNLHLTILFYFFIDISVPFSHLYLKLPYLYWCVYLHIWCLFLYFLYPSPNASCIRTGILLVAFMVVSQESRKGPDTRHRKHVRWILLKKKSSHLTWFKQILSILTSHLSSSTNF